MSLLIRFLFVASLIVAIASPASASIVVNFDDLPDLVGLDAVPDGYGGITWSGNWEYFALTGPDYYVASSPNAVYRKFAGFIPPETFFSFSSPVVFEGAYFSGFPNFANPYFNLYLGDDLVATSSTLVIDRTPQFLSSGYSGLVDRVGVFSFSSYDYAMDDVTFRTAEAQAVPEPASVAIWGFGALGLAVAGYRRKSA